MNTTEQIDVGYGWQLLKEGDLLQKGDERGVLNRWSPTIHYGERADNSQHYRRRIDVGKGYELVPEEEVRKAQEIGPPPFESWEILVHNGWVPVALWNMAWKEWKGQPVRRPKTKDQSFRYPENLGETIRPVESKPETMRYSVERLECVFGIYEGRDPQHHGVELGHLTEYVDGLPKLIERALNHYARYQEQTPKLSSYRETIEEALENKERQAASTRQSFTESELQDAAKLWVQATYPKQEDPDAFYQRFGMLVDFISDLMSSKQDPEF